MNGESPSRGNGSHAALVIAHPGHELRVHGWVAAVRPKVFVLTDGSGRSGRSRLASTDRILAALGAEAGSIYGRFTDRALYDAILDQPAERLVELAEELAQALVGHRVDCVAGDAREGYNPAHDLCRHLIDTAVHLARRSVGWPIASYDFPLVAPPDACPARLRAAAVRLDLDEGAFARKLLAARGYPEIGAEVDCGLDAAGPQAFRVELLRPVEAGTGWNPAEPPFYERLGERRVAEGHYRRVLRHREHVVPLAAALRRRIDARA